MAQSRTIQHGLGSKKPNCMLFVHQPSPWGGWVGPGAHIEHKDCIGYDEDDWLKERAVEEVYAVSA